MTITILNLKNYTNIQNDNGESGTAVYLLLLNSITKQPARRSRGIQAAETAPINTGLVKVVDIAEHKGTQNILYVSKLAVASDVNKIITGFLIRTFHIRKQYSIFGRQKHAYHYLQNYPFEEIKASSGKFSRPFLGKFHPFSLKHM